MAIWLAVACAISVAGIWAVERRRVQRRLQRRGVLLTQALEQVNSELPPVAGRSASAKGLEMDRLLHELELATEMLNSAQAVEASLSESAELDEARAAVLKAEEDYNEAANAYRTFVQSLAPPLRAAAVERGARAMTIQHA